MNKQDETTSTTWRPEPFKFHAIEFSLSGSTKGWGLKEWFAVIWGFDIWWDNIPLLKTWLVIFAAVDLIL